MTMTDDRITTTDLAGQARATWQEAAAKPTAVELGRQFGRSERWARDRIREARQDAGSGTAADRQAPAERPADSAADPAAAAERPADSAADPATDLAEEVTTSTAAAADDTRLTWWVSVIAVVVVGGVALVMSYDHMRLLAEESGEGWRSWLLPISVDGLMIAASSVILARQRQGVPAGWLPWMALVAGVAVSVAANIAQAGADLKPIGSDGGPATEADYDDLLLKARLLAAWPPLAALAGVELLMRQIRGRQQAGRREDQQQFGV